MDLFEIISGRIILEFLGAFVRFIYFNLSILFSDDDFRTFSSFWSPSGSKNKKGENDDRNHMIGVIFIGAFVFLLIVFNV